MVGDSQSINEIIKRSKRILNSTSKYRTVNKRLRLYGYNLPNIESTKYSKGQTFDNIKPYREILINSKAPRIDVSENTKTPKKLQQKKGILKHNRSFSSPKSVSFHGTVSIKPVTPKKKSTVIEGSNLSLLDDSDEEIFNPYIPSKINSRPNCATSTPKKYNPEINGECSHAPPKRKLNHKLPTPKHSKISVNSDSLIKKCNLRNHKKEQLEINLPRPLTRTGRILANIKQEPRLNKHFHTQLKNTASLNIIKTSVGKPVLRKKLYVHKNSDLNQSQRATSGKIAANLDKKLLIFGNTTPKTYDKKPPTETKNLEKDKLDGKSNSPDAVKSKNENLDESKDKNIDTSIDKDQNLNTSENKDVDLNMSKSKIDNLDETSSKDQNLDTGECNDQNLDTTKNKDQNLEIIENKDQNSDATKNKEQNLESAISNDQNLDITKKEDQNLSLVANKDQNADSTESKKQNLDSGECNDQNLEVTKNKDQNIDMTENKDQNLNITKTKDQNLDAAEDKDDNLDTVKSQNLNLDTTKSKDQNLGPIESKNLDTIESKEQILNLDNVIKVEKIDETKNQNLDTIKKENQNLDTAKSKNTNLDDCDKNKKIDIVEVKKESVDIEDLDSVESKIERLHADDNSSVIMPSSDVKKTSINDKRLCSSSSTANSAFSDNPKPISVKKSILERAIEDINLDSENQNLDNDYTNAANSRIISNNTIQIKIETTEDQGTGIKNIVKNIKIDDPGKNSATRTTLGTIEHPQIGPKKPNIIKKLGSIESPLITSNTISKKIPDKPVNRRSTIENKKPPIVNKKPTILEKKEPLRSTESSNTIPLPLESMVEVKIDEPSPEVDPLLVPKRKRGRPRKNNPDPPFNPFASKKKPIIIPKKPSPPVPDNGVPKRKRGRPRKKIVFGFQTIVSEIKLIALPSDLWSAHVSLNSKKSQVCFTRLVQPISESVPLEFDRSVKFNGTNKYFVKINNRNVELIGAPTTVDSLADVEILLDIVNDININDPVLRYFTR